MNCEECSIEQAYQATLLCRECDQLFCGKCDIIIHSRGKRRTHSRQIVCYNCRSAASTMNSAQTTATVTAPPPAPTAVFSFNNVQQPNVTTVGNSPVATLASTKEISYSTQQPFNFSYNSANTSSCQLDAFYAATPL